MELCVGNFNEIFVRKNIFWFILFNMRIVLQLYNREMISFYSSVKGNETKNNGKKY